MTSFRDRLIENYSTHYRRVSVDADHPAEMSTKAMRGLDLTFGYLLDSLPAGSRILDLGCGTGSLVQWLRQRPGIEPAGVDLSAGQVAIARKALPDCDIACGDALEYLAAHPTSFTGIFCFDLLEHVPTLDEYPRWFDVIRGALQPGGFFCCRVPNAANLTGNYSRYMDLTHERVFTRTSLLQLLELSGLERPKIVPICRPTLSGRLRLIAESWIHRALFRLCGRDRETVFTSNLCAVAFAPMLSAARPE